MRGDDAGAVAIEGEVSKKNLVKDDKGEEESAAMMGTHKVLGEVSNRRRSQGGLTKLTATEDDEDEDGVEVAEEI